MEVMEVVWFKWSTTAPNPVKATNVEIMNEFGKSLYYDMGMMLKTYKQSDSIQVHLRSGFTVKIMRKYE